VRSVGKVDEGKGFVYYFNVALGRNIKLIEMHHARNPCISFEQTYLKSIALFS
jgi:hypothetical protein